MPAVFLTLYYQISFLTSNDSNSLEEMNIMKRTYPIFKYLGDVAYIIQVNTYYLAYFQIFNYIYIKLNSYLNLIFKKYIKLINLFLYIFLFAMLLINNSLFFFIVQISMFSFFFHIIQISNAMILKTYFKILRFYEKKNSLNLLKLD
ncbi:hypothetical protein IEQ34_005512 [Dendrobium chrysotoxum]|uniref:Transmembrane protein n=1 Tax=Dendrobium chrysotoxum TaxID=161865 RepID=A0AAV7HCH0_DENCH|nr:hypothetical protein IEQ34_005512 [Dendrobium chrysotoxum]